MAIRYRSIAKEASAEQIIDRSRFIAHIGRCTSREEAERYIADIRERYRDATHNVPCFICGEKQELMWASDDGEPSGTSGPPMLQMFAREGLTNIVCVVTRYFGGIKLGTGGLVRAYTSSARLALEAAGIREVRDMREIRLRIPYAALEKLRHMEQNLPFAMYDLEYTDSVTLSISYEPEDEENVLLPIRELLAAEPEILESKSFLR
ncbi:MAG TPA: YigZ family protein [Bacillota bacterium]|nr:YigZ family protein [Bacillota bacterium]